MSARKPPTVDWVYRPHTPLLWHRVCIGVIHLLARVVLVAMVWLGMVATLTGLTWLILWLVTHA